MSFLLCTCPSLRLSLLRQKLIGAPVGIRRPRVLFAVASPTAPGLLRCGAFVGQALALCGSSTKIQSLRRLWRHRRHPRYSRPLGQLSLVRWVE